ncbi:unnamed protein product [Prunus armeniaca]
MIGCFNVLEIALKVKVSWEGLDDEVIQASAEASRAMMGILDPRTMKCALSVGLRTIGSGIVRYGRRCGKR